MNHRRSLICGLIGLLLVTHAGCNSASHPAASADVTEAQLAAFNEALAAAPRALSSFDGQDAFAKAVQQSLGPDKTSLEEARRIRDEALELFDSSIENLKAAPTPYAPEAWAMKQACLSFLAAGRDTASDYFNEMIDVSQDESLDAEAKSKIGSMALLRKNRSMATTRKLQEEAEVAWQAWLNARSSTN